MSGQIARPFASIALVATLLISGLGVAAAPTTARADDCLIAPNSSAPQGSHWYYRSDRATKRKCWHVRAPDQPAQQAAAPTTTGPATPLHSTPAPSGPTPVAADAPMSLSPGDTATPPPHVKILAVKPLAAQAITAKTDKQRSAQEGNTAPSIPEAPAPQASTSSQTGAQAAGPAPASAAAWPDATPAVAMVKAQEPIAVATDAPAASVSDDAEKTARRGEPTNNAGMPMIIFPGLALGLAAVGILSLVVRKIAAARRARIIINHPEPDRVDDQAQHERRDDPDHERQEYHSLISAVSDYTPFPAEDSAFETIPKISKREDKLAELRQDLDRMLQSPASPHEAAA
jgi:hypothetical protein